MDLLSKNNFLARMLKQREETKAPTTAAVAGNVLVVDDSKTMVHALQMILNRAGHTTMPAFDGVEAIDLARKHSPDVILMDIVMPRMNGFEATRALKADPATRGIPIVIVSGSDQESDRMWGTRLGARAFVSKPINKDELLKIINKILAPTTTTGVPVRAAVPR